MNAPDPNGAGDQLLDDIKDFISRFVVLPSESVGDLLALWTLHTHALPAAVATPYLRVVSAAPDSGKTLLLEVLSAITRNGWHTVSPSTATLFRKVHRDQPTLLLDELDNYAIGDRQEALSILNAGYKRGATVPRCTEKGELVESETFCPKAFAGLDVGPLPDTLLSRSVTIRLEAKLSSENVDMWIAQFVAQDAEALRERCEEWGSEHLEALEEITPDLLGLVNRRAEVWWALLAIGEYIGGEWQERARGAARALGTGGDEADEMSSQVQLLADIRDALGEERTIFTDDLLASLNALDESPWGARRRGEGLDRRGLARMLRPFRIRPKSVRVGDESRKGYHVDQFEDAFARYLAPPGRVTSVTSVTSAPQSQANVAPVTHVTHSEGGSNGHPELPLSADQEAEIARVTGACPSHAEPAAGCRYCEVAV